MAGGRGTRLDAAVEKPLFEVAGRPMIDRVLDALVGSRIDAIHVATSPATPATRDHVGAAVIETPGDGYVADLEVAMTAAGIEEPALTVTADLPLLAAEPIDGVIEVAGVGSLTVAVPVALKRKLGLSVDATLETDDRWAPSGLNVVGGPSGSTLRCWDVRAAVNVNHVGDARVAESFLNPRKD
jgi:adenosylcobinamide-phosphate guanylyltransferase